MSDEKKDLSSLNLDDLDVEELERRIELVAAHVNPDDPVICYVNCGNVGSPPPKNPPPKLQ
jgi:hypothetical protein